MRYLITGINGFVGKHLAILLATNGHDVYGLSRSNDTNLNDIKILKCDIRSSYQVDNIFYNTKFDAVFHLAAQTHIPYSFSNPVETFNINTFGTINICDAIEEYNSNCILMQCSTGDVYKEQSEDVLIDETFLLNPSNPYAVSKACADLYVLERAQNNKIKTFIVRPFSHTGPGRSPKFSIASDALQIAKILNHKQDPIINVGNLEAKRPIMDVRDVVNIYELLMMNAINGKINNGEIYNVGNNKLHKIGYYLDVMLDMFNLKDIEKVTDKTLLRPNDSNIKIPNTNKLDTLLNYKQKYCMEKTLKDLVEYFINNI